LDTVKLTAPPPPWFTLWMPWDTDSRGGMRSRVSFARQVGLPAADERQHAPAPGLDDEIAGPLLEAGLPGQAEGFAVFLLLGREGAVDEFHAPAVLHAADVEGDQAAARAGELDGELGAVGGGLAVRGEGDLGAPPLRRKKKMAMPARQSRASTVKPCRNFPEPFLSMSRLILG